MEYTLALIEAFFGDTRPVTEAEIKALSQEEYNELWQGAEKELAPFD